MTGDDEQESGYAIVMPFVTVTSRGGPHDDAAYCAGFECGRWDAILSHLVGGEVPSTAAVTVPATVNSENLPQLDLIAMRRGFRVETVPADDEVEGWATIQFVRSGGAE